MKLPNPFKPPPVPPGFGAGKVVPEQNAPLLSRLTFSWIGSFLAVGFSRPLQEDDLWSLPDNMLTINLTNGVEKAFYSRVEPFKQPQYLQEKQESTLRSHLRASQSTNVAEGPPAHGANKEKVPTYDSSLFRALHKTFLTQIWVAGFLKLVAETLRTTTPLVSKVFLSWLAKSYFYHRYHEDAGWGNDFPRPHGVGFGIGIAFGLFAMQEMAGLINAHYSQISQRTGLQIRTGLIGAIFRKSLRLSGRAKLEHNVGQITTMVSTDTEKLSRLAAVGHDLWVSPIQIALAIGLLIANLGYSALVGLGILLLGLISQVFFMKISLRERKKVAKITDKRLRLTNEILQGVRLIKYFAWESFYLHQVGDLREKEIRTIRTSVMARTVNLTVILFVPMLAAISSFITYALSGHRLNAAIIFSSLQLFNIIRSPLSRIPMDFTILSNGLVALDRISSFLLSEDLATPYRLDDGMTHDALLVDGSFIWEVAGRLDKPGKAGKVRKSRGGKQSVLPIATPEVEEPVERRMVKENQQVFQLQDLLFSVAKGSFVAIVGRVGSGKSSLLQAVIGEMRRTHGEVVVSGSVAYASQTPWIRNGTLKDNVLFGCPNNEARFRQVIHACGLERDLETLPHGELTEIGEKGINLSGGQKARISLARAAYSYSDIVLLDDPLSAVDAHVGKSILENCLLDGPLANRTRILVTHALHVLEKTDYIYVVDDGRIVERGTFFTLLKDGGLLSRVVEEYGNRNHRVVQEQNAKATGSGLAGPNPILGRQIRKGPSKGLIQAEERNTGAITWDTYAKYFYFSGSTLWAPILAFLLMLSQTAQISTNLMLGFWIAKSLHNFTQENYMTVYAASGFVQVTLSFLYSVALFSAGLKSSINLSGAVLHAVLRSPISFFDTTPIGRIIARLSRDQDTIDHEVALTSWQLSTRIGMVIGSMGLVFYAFPYLGIIFVPMAIFYYVTSMYYRRTSIETQRLDSLMRSTLYGSYTETLTGLPTIRAYRAQEMCLKTADQGLDKENRAYYMRITIQQWLSVRIELIGNILILGIALFAVYFRNSVGPARVGVVLSYILSIFTHESKAIKATSEVSPLFASNEQNMNAVERVLHYTELPAEGERCTPNDPPISWPHQGHLSFHDVYLSYREGLPCVLKGISFDVHAGEKIGIVGRTGAGKSSLLQALFRIVELQAGKIEIDGYDIRKIGLDTLRSKLAFVPQENVLFLGTLRENIDPLRSRTDTELISILQRAWLLPRNGEVSDSVAEAKFSLDSVVDDEGSNFSAGEKQLLALCRALVKDSRIIVLDEATSSVDVETDAKIQKTLSREFENATVLCIAHRLNTVAYYDRILVMDDGNVAEFDTVLNLFDDEGSIFRSLCNEANLSWRDIMRVREKYSIPHTY